MRKGSGFLINAGPTLIILAMLHERPQPAFDLALELERRTNGKLTLHKSTLYPLVNKLQKQGLVGSKWEIPENEDARRVYFLTEKGLKEAASQRQLWNEYVRTIDQALAGPA